MLLLAAEKRDRGRERKEDIQAMGRSKWVKKINNQEDEGKEFGGFKVTGVQVCIDVAS